ncbi:Ig-like domain-containing protein [Deinococcus sp. UYEF24]
MVLLPWLLMLAAAPQPTSRPPLIVCAQVARPLLDLIVKNERGQVLRQLNWLESSDATWLKITYEGDHATVTVNRRWYKPQTIRNIKVPDDGCGPAHPTRVVVRLQPVAGAPIIREFRIATVNSDNRMGVGYWPFFWRYTTFLDASGSVSRDVLWTNSRPDVATVDSGGMLRSVCSREGASTTITATLKADPKYTSSTYFSRGGRGMVCPRGAVDR